eukprot:214090-Rhodomonas_salina.2
MAHVLVTPLAVIVLFPRAVLQPRCGVLPSMRSGIPGGRGFVLRVFRLDHPVRIFLDVAEPLAVVLVAGHAARGVL